MQNDSFQSSTSNLPIHELKTKYKKLTTPLLLTSSLKNHKSIFNLKKKQKMQLLLQDKLIGYHEILKANKIKINFPYSCKYFEKLQSNIPSLKKYAQYLLKDYDVMRGRDESEEREEKMLLEAINMKDQENVRKEQIYNRNSKISRFKIRRGRPEIFSTIRYQDKLSNHSPPVMKNVTTTSHPGRCQSYFQGASPNPLFLRKPQKFIINKSIQSVQCVKRQPLHKLNMNNMPIRRKVSSSVMDERDENRQGNDLRKIDGWNQSRMIVKDYGFGIKTKYSRLNTIQ